MSRTVGGSSGLGSRARLVFGAMLAVSVVSALVFVGCGGDDGDDGGNPNGPGGDGGYTYNGPTVKIGTQTWMAKNLDRRTDSSKCFGEGNPEAWVGGSTSSTGGIKTLSDSEIQENCTKYGRLYNWADAMTVCPSGWYLPSSDEWSTLIDYAGGDIVALIKLKSTSGWVEECDSDYKSCGNGTDDYGFSALPGGTRDPSGKFQSIGAKGRWWSSTESYGWEAVAPEMNIEYANVRMSASGTNQMYSVRCLKN